MKPKITSLVLISVLMLSACASRNHGGESGDAPPYTGEPNPLVPRAWGPNYKYNELMTKDYDEMLAMVQLLVKKAHKATTREDNTASQGEAVEYLGRSLKLIFSRPDSDNMVTKLVGEVRRDLQGFNSYEDVIIGLTDEALRLAKNADAPVIVQSTALVEIENIMAEIRPEVQNGNMGLRRAVQAVRDSDLRMSEDVKRDRRLRGMFKTKNPSEEAGDLLKALEKAKKKK